MSLSGAIKAGRAYVEISGDRNPLDRVLKEASASLANFGASVSAIGAGIFAGGAAIVAPIVGAAKSFANTGDELDELSAHTGVSTKSLTELGFAMTLAGVQTADFEAALRKSNATIAAAGQGSKEANASLAAIGLSFADLASLNPEQQFLAIGKALDRVPNATAKAAAAQDLFGRSAAKMFPLFQDGARGIDQARAAATALGLTFSGDEIQAAVRLADAFDTLGAVAKRTFDAIGSAVSPIVEDVTNSIISVVASVNRWIQANPGAVQSALKIGAAIAGVGAAVTVGGAAILGFAGVIAAGQFVFATFGTVLAGVGAAFGAIVSAAGLLLTPIGAVAAAATAGAAAFLYFSGVGGDVVQYLIDTFGELQKWVGDVVGAIGNALKGGDVKAAAEVLWASLAVVWAKGVETIVVALKPMLDGFTNLFASIRTGWTNLIGFMTEVAIGANDVFGPALDSFAAANLRTMELPEEDVRDFERSRALIREQESKAAGDAIVAARKETAEKLDQIESDRLKKLLSNQTQIDAAVAAEQKAQEALAGAIAKANAVRSGAGAPTLAKQKDIDALERVADRVSQTIGGFSGSALANLGGTERVQADIKENTKITYLEMRAMVASMRTLIQIAQKQVVGF